MLTAVSVALLLAVLAFAVLRPGRLPEAVAAVPAAAILVAIGAVSVPAAIDEARRLAPVVGFLAAVLVLARLCADEGLFQAAGALMAQTCVGRPRRLLTEVFGIAAVTTAILSLDATVVLLTPVVFATARRLGARTKPHAYACTHLANSGSLLLPVSNLTNLLAFTAAGISFTRFAALMVLPWLACLTIEFLVFRRFFARDLVIDDPVPANADRREIPVFTLVVLALTLAGFVVTSPFGINPAWSALAGVLVLGGRALARRRTTVRRIVGAAAVPFLAFVLALGIVVRAVVGNGLSGAVGDLIPRGTSLPALLALAAVAAVLANVVNNLPAVLVLLPLVTPTGPAAILAVLIGVGVGPNLTYVGSLATLLWRRVLHEHAKAANLGEFTRLGLLTVPASLVTSVLALWAALRI